VVGDKEIVEHGFGHITAATADPSIVAEVVNKHRPTDDHNGPTVKRKTEKKLRAQNKIESNKGPVGLQRGHRSIMVAANPSVVVEIVNAENPDVLVAVHQFAEGEDVIFSMPDQRSSSSPAVYTKLGRQRAKPVANHMREEIEIKKGSQHYDDEEREL